jgi:redox-sensing transcriptional repressor
LTLRNAFYIIKFSDEKRKVKEVEAKGISQAVIQRLPRYYRYLGDLLDNNVERISSKDLSRRMNVTASQIRQDLNNFGGFGQQGYGYNVKFLHTEIGKILGLDASHKFVIIGAGNLGQALANYSSFENSGFVLAGIFDVNPVLKGTSIRGVPIRMMDELKMFIEENKIEIAVLTVPKQNASEVADLLADTNIKGIMNFAHTDLKLPKQMIVENVHVSDSLMKLSYKIGREQEGILEE